MVAHPHGAPRLEPRPAAIVLAAGESRRMGRPKALLPAGGGTLVAQHVERFASLGCEPITALVRPPLGDAVRGAVGLRASVLVVETGSQAASLAAGARRLRAGGVEPTAPVLVTPVDLLPPGEAVCRALLAALRGEVMAATPLFRARGGHPVALRAAALLEIAAADPSVSLREHLAAMGSRRVRVPVDDARILGDLDHPEDVAALG